MSTNKTKARAVGINHVALEVGDIDEALAFYGSLFEFGLRSRGDKMAFIDMGDQFLALSRVEERHADAERHFGLVVDDKAAIRARLERANVPIVPDAGLTFRDPWGNQIQIVEYADVQFSKAPHVLRGMELTGLTKTEKAEQELRQKGMAPD